MNPHQYGGLYEFQRITAEAAIHIKDHNHKIHWGAEGYKGSMVFYRSSIYATLVHRALNGKPVDNIDDLSYDELADVFDKITYSNTVKCSPNYQGSNPTKAMFNNCPQHILKKEIDILKPTHIIVLGQDAASALVQGLNLKFIRSYDNSHLYKGEDLTVFEAPHPASRISNENRFNGFIEMVKDYNN